MVADHSGAFYTPEIGIGFPCGTVGSAPGGINHRPGRTIYARWEPDPQSRCAKRTNRAVKTLTEWASAGAEPWCLYLFIPNP